MMTIKLMIISSSVSEVRDSTEIHLQIHKKLPNQLDNNSNVVEEGV